MLPHQEGGPHLDGLGIPVRLPQPHVQQLERRGQRHPSPAPAPPQHLGGEHPQSVPKPESQHIDTVAELHQHEGGEAEVEQEQNDAEKDPQVARHLHVRQGLIRSSNTTNPQECDADLHEQHLRVQYAVHGGVEAIIPVRRGLFCT